MKSGYFVLFSTSAIFLFGLSITPLSAQQVAPSASFAIGSIERKAVLEASLAEITANYVFPEKAPVITKALRRKLSAGGYDGINDSKVFAQTVTDDIAAIAHDRHLRLIWSATPLLQHGADNKPTSDAAVQDQVKWARHNYFIPKVEVFDGNVGYIKLNLFVDAQSAGSTLASAMAFVQHTDALIFDLRDNHGGDPGMVAMVVSYLVPPETRLDDIHRRGQSVDDQIWSFPFVPGGRWSTDKPVYVLTSNETGSGAEAFAYDLQQMKRGTIIGGSTWGGANPGSVFAIDQHFEVFVPTGAAVNPISKTNWDGVGVKPDVAVDPKEALEIARRMALGKLLTGATGDRRMEIERALSMQPHP
jgi:hypothetical protein